MPLPLKKPVIDCAARKSSSLPLPLGMQMCRPCTTSDNLVMLQPASSPGFGMFGQQPAKPFGQTTGSQPFGQSSPSLFGSPAPGGLFGAPASSSAFGSGGLFSTPQSTGSNVFSFAQSAQQQTQLQNSAQLPGKDSCFHLSDLSKIAWRLL
jgi:hypothetical protein